jgi:serine/threonine protein phosphatase PrpC
MALLGGKRPDRSDRTATIDVGSATAVGGRIDNQDRCAVSPGWAVVSDGAGGHAGGARAAELTVGVLAAGLADLAREPGPDVGDRLATLITRANAAVRAERARDASVSTMAATATVALALAAGPGGSRWLVANVGDSPGWRIGATDCERFTQEHNVTGELVRAGVLGAEEARTHHGRHLITRAIGSEDTVAPAVTTVELEPGDALVLASDGIDVVPPDVMATLVRGAPGADAAARTLVQAALSRHASDNVTAVVVVHRPSSGDAPFAG